MLIPFIVGDKVKYIHQLATVIASNDLGFMCVFTDGLVHSNYNVHFVFWKEATDWERLENKSE